MVAVINFVPDIPEAGSLEERSALLIGHKNMLTRSGVYEASVKAIAPKGEVSKEALEAAIKALSPSAESDSGDTVPLFGKLASVVSLPERCSRSNCPSRPDALKRLVKGAVKSKDTIIVVVCPRSHVVASACAIARAFPLYSQKTSGKKEPYTVTVSFVLLDVDGIVGGDSLKAEECANVSTLAESVRYAAKLTDMPTCELNCTAFTKEALAIAKSLGSRVSVQVIAGAELEAKGFGGLFGVGKAADSPPALVILSYDGTGGGSHPGDTLCWVGKGIVYDTGGLSIKSKEGMPTMKRDMGGAAGVLMAFNAAVKIGVKKRLHALLCIAENAVNQVAYRPDDILHMLSGKTVEVNNTDAEGRLVLADGVHYAASTLKGHVVVDMCTLTGAQKIAAGNLHAGIMCNDEVMEHACVNAGKQCGDLCVPLVYCPEVLMKEFKSEVADMKNSVASRTNAQASCAGHFIEAHLPQDFHGKWLHIDMAGPVDEADRCTGYGVALLVQLFGQPVIEG